MGNIREASVTMESVTEYPKGCPECLEGRPVLHGFVTVDAGNCAGGYTGTGLGETAFQFGRGSTETRNSRGNWGPGDQKCEVCARQDGLQEFGMSDERLNEISNAVRQIRFIYELMDSIRHDIVTKIIAGKVPTTWSGIELRRLVADKTKSADYVRWTKKAEDEYENIVIVNNL